MSTAYALDLFDVVNGMLDSDKVLQLIDFHSEKLQQSGETIKAFCPIHKDSRFRSLLVDAERQAFRCTIKTCQGYGGGSLVELYALSNDISTLSATSELIKKLELPMPDQWRDDVIGSFLIDAENAKQHGDLSEAERLLTEVARAFPDVADSSVKLADIHEETGNSQAAVEEFIRLIEHLISIDRTQDAEALATDAIKRFPNNEDLLFIRVKIAEDLKDIPLTVERIREIIQMRETAGRNLDNVGILEKLVKIAPDDPGSAIKLAELYEQQHNVRAASLEYEKASDIYAQSGDNQTSIELLEKVVQYNSENVKARQKLAAKLSAIGNIDSARDHTFRVVTQFIDQQEFGNAVTAVNGWLETEPDNIDARELLSRVFMDQERSTEAASHLLDGAAIAEKQDNFSRSTDLLLRAKFLTPDNRELRQQLIAAFQKTGELQRAAFEIIDLAEILYTAEDNQLATDLLVSETESDISLALKLQMVSLLANHSENYTALQILHTLVEDIDAGETSGEVADLYELLATLEPENENNHRRRFEAQWEVSPDLAGETVVGSVNWLVQHDKASEAANLLEVVSDRIDAYCPSVSQLFDLCLQLDHFDFAGKIYQSSIEGWAGDNPEAALKAALRIAETNPAHPSAPSDIAFLLAGLGRTKEAAIQYAQVAMLLLEADDCTSGYQYAQEAVQLDPESIKARAAQALLGQEVLPAEQALLLFESLLESTRQAKTREDIADGYFACVELDPQNSELLKEAATSLKSLEFPEALAQIQAKQAMLLSSSGEWDKACSLLKEASESAPQLPQIHEQYGEACKVTHDNEGAAIAFASAAISYAHSGDLENALRCTSSSQMSGSDSIVALEALFNAASATKQEDIASDTVEALTLAYAESGPAPNTAKWAREWVRLAPDNARSHKALGQALIAVDQTDNASHALSTAAAIFSQSGDDKNALEVLQNSFNKNLTTERDVNTLASILSHQFKETELHEQAAKLLGQLHLLSGNLDKARAIGHSMTATLPSAQLWTEIAKAEFHLLQAMDDYIQAADIYQQLDLAAEAIERLETAASLGEVPLSINERLASLYTDAHRPDDALPHQLIVLSSLAENNEPGLTKLLDQLRNTHEADENSLIKIAKVLLKAQLPELAVIDMETAAAIAEKNNNTPALITICGLDENLTRQSSILTRVRADTLMGMKNEEQALAWVAESSRSLLKSGKASEAWQMAEKWISLAPDNLDALRIYGAALEMDGKTSEAFATNIKVTETLSESDPAEALEFLDEILDTHQFDIQGLKLKAELQKRLNRNVAASITLMQLADQHFRSGDITGSLACYRDSALLDPANTDAIWKQAELINESEGVSAALPTYKRWLKVRRKTVEFDQWIDDLKNVLPLAPQSASMLFDLTDALIKAGRFSEATNHLQTLAELQENEGDYEGAAHTLELLISNASITPPDEHLRIALLYEKAEFSSQAQTHLRKAVTGFQDSGKPKRAAEACEELLKLTGDSTLPEDYSMAAAAHAKCGNSEAANKMVAKALTELDKHSGNLDRKESMLAQALEIAPLNPEYLSRHLNLLPTGRAISEGLRVSKDMQTAGHHEDAIQILSQVISFAPHDMTLRLELFKPLRKTENKNRLRNELLSLASDALAAGDTDAAHEALDEVAELATTPQQYRTVAELNERARRMEQAAEQFAAAAIMFSEDEKKEQAIAAINRAVTARPLSVPTKAMVKLIQTLGEDVHAIAREQLRAALTARNQKQSHALALALLETISPSRTNDILKVVFTLGGSTFLVGIALIRVENLIKSDNIDEALEITKMLISIAPDSPDAWYLAARVYRSADQSKNARRAAMEAARLYNAAGAVIEEETCYQEAIAADPSDVTTKTIYSDYLVHEKREDEAVTLLGEIIQFAELNHNSDLLFETLNKAVQIAPSNTDYREKLARSLEKIAPDTAIENWLQVADNYREVNQIERAKRVHEHVLELNPNNETAQEGLLAIAKESADIETAGRLSLSLANSKAGHKKIGEACRLLQAHLEIEPDNLPVLELLSELSANSKDNEVFNKTALILARKFQKLGNNEKAFGYYEQLLENKPRDAALLSTLIDCTAAVGQSQKGLEYARRLLTVAHDTEDPERIRLAAATILQYDDSDPQVHQDLGESLLSLNRVSEAITEWLRAAELFEGNGSIPNAFNCYRHVTQLSPSTMQAWRRLCDLALTIGDLETAQKSIVQVVEKSTDQESARAIPLLNRMLKEIPDDQNIHETALGFYRKTNETDNFVRESIWLANQYMESGNHEKAEDILTAALKITPDNRQLKNVHYDTIRQMGKLEELQAKLRQESLNHIENAETEKAIGVLKELADLVPGQIGVHRDLVRLLESVERNDEALEQNLQIIRLLLNRSELEEARETSESVIARYPEKMNCRELIADLLAETSYNDLSARYYRAAAESSIDRKKYAPAIDLLHKAIKVHPQWVDAHKLLAETCQKAKHPDEAFEAWLALLPVLLATGEFADATETLDKLVKLRPDSLEVKVQLAELYEKTGKDDEYAKTVQEVAELYDKAGESEKALNCYRKLTATAPEDAGILTRYIELLTQSESQPTDLTKQYTQLADILTRQGDYEGAFQTYEQVLGLNPDDTSARSRYATFLLTRGNRSRALTEMRKLATLYAEREEFVAAIEVLNAALTISPRDADICLALANAQENAGMHEDARVSYARASAILASTAAVKGIDTYRRILSQDEHNTAVRLRLVELLIKSGDKMEAAREARILAEIHVGRGEMNEAKNAYRIVDDCEPESLDDIRLAIQRDSYDPSLQYVHYVRLANALFDTGDIDGALDAYRTARSLHDDSPELIQKCIDCVSLIAPEAEAVPDYLLMAEKLQLDGDLITARQTYEKVRQIDPFNNDARCGIESVEAAERQQFSPSKPNDDLILKASRTISKRVALMDLLNACQDAAHDQTGESNKLGG